MSAQDMRDCYVAPGLFSDPAELDGAWRNWDLRFTCAASGHTCPPTDWLDFIFHWHDGYYWHDYWIGLRRYRGSWWWTNGDPLTYGLIGLNRTGDVIITIKTLTTSFGLQSYGARSGVGGWGKYFKATFVCCCH
ncbi:hypothetical protein Bbelb_361350 [Branchiostoma belcheri]|nr:hypothetical protein Bbelb_361350 [Branchiostoma belcheri]